MDAVDRKILAELQAEGRLTVTELAQRVALSVAPCHRRLRELERTGAIRGYRAVIDPAAIGLGFEVLVQVTMEREDAATISRFESGLADIAEVRHAERLFGDPDYLVRVATADLAAYQGLRDEKLATLPGVQRLTSTIVMKRVVDDRPFRVSPTAGRSNHRPLGKIQKAGWQASRYPPAAARSWSTRSRRSQEKSGSVRPKCP